MEEKRTSRAATRTIKELEVHEDLSMHTGTVQYRYSRLSTGYSTGTGSVSTTISTRTTTLLLPVDYPKVKSRLPGS